MIKVRAANPPVFSLREFNGPLGTQSWQAVLPIYSNLKDQIKPDGTNDTVNGIIDPVKDDLQTKINTAIDNTYIAHAVPEPTALTVTSSSTNPADMPKLIVIYKEVFKAFRDARNGKYRRGQCH